MRDKNTPKSKRNAASVITAIKSRLAHNPDSRIRQLTDSDWSQIESILETLSPVPTIDKILSSLDKIIEVIVGK